VGAEKAYRGTPFTIRVNGLQVKVAGGFTMAGTEFPRGM
jgi:hypothetical protein